MNAEITASTEYSDKLNDIKQNINEEPLPEKGELRRQVDEELDPSVLKLIGRDCNEAAEIRKRVRKRKARTSQRKSYEHATRSSAERGAH